MCSGGGGGWYKGPNIFELLSRRHVRRLYAVVVVAGAELGVGCDVGVVNCWTAVLWRADSWCCVSVCLSITLRIIRVHRRLAWGALRCMHRSVARAQPDVVRRQWADISHSLRSDYASGLMCDTDRIGGRMCVTLRSFYPFPWSGCSRCCLLFVCLFVPVLKLSRMIEFCACTECLQAHWRVFR